MKLSESRKCHIYRYIYIYMLYIYIYTYIYISNSKKQCLPNLARLVLYIYNYIYTHCNMIFTMLICNIYIQNNIRRPLPSLGLGGAAPGITVAVRHGLVPALASKPQNLRSSFRRRAACLAMQAVSIGLRNCFSKALDLTTLRDPPQQLAMVPP